MVYRTQVICKLNLVGDGKAGSQDLTLPSMACYAEVLTPATPDCLVGFDAGQLLRATPDRAFADAGRSPRSCVHGSKPAETDVHLYRPALSCFACT